MMIAPAAEELSFQQLDMAVLSACQFLSSLITQEVTLKMQTKAVLAQTRADIDRILQERDQHSRSLHVSAGTIDKKTSNTMEDRCGVSSVQSTHQGVHPFSPQFQDRWTRSPPMHVEEDDQQDDGPSIEGSNNTPSGKTFETADDRARRRPDYRADRTATNLIKQLVEEPLTKTTAVPSSDLQPSRKSPLPRFSVINAITAAATASLQLHLLSSRSPQQQFPGTSSAPGSDAIRRPKRRALLAVEPYLELSLQESQQSLMMKVFGSFLTDKWFKRKRLVVFLTWAATVVWYVTFYLALFAFALHRDEKMSIIWSMVSLLCNFWCVVSHTSFVNYSLLKRSLQTFDTLFFLAEITSFAIALWGALCVSVAGFLVCFNCWLFVCNGWVFYDCYPIVARRGLRKTLVIGFVSFVTPVVLVYIFMPSKLCSYFIHFWDADGGEEGDAAAVENTMGIRRPGWRISVLDFGLNRAATVAILMLKILYAAFKHPRDCAMIKRRVRLIEAVVPPAPHDTTGIVKGKQISER